MLLKSEFFTIRFYAEEGRIKKEFSGSSNPEDYFSIEAGITKVMAELYNTMGNPSDIMDGVDEEEKSLLKLVFSKDRMGRASFSVTGQMQTKEAENVLVGLASMYMQLHLKRMVKDEVKMVMQDDNRLNSVSYQTDEELT